jgi:HK97 family phage prohead protease
MKNKLLFKSFKVDNFTEENNRLTISGWAATFGNIDAGGDVIMPGAFTKTLQDRKGRIAFCYQHEIDEPIGNILILEERPKGLWIEVMLSAAEDDIQTKVKEGILKEMSIGYCVINSNITNMNGVEITNLTEIKLYEVSLVTIAMNEMAMVEGMKSEERKNYFDTAFDRLIAVERNDASKFELLKLKSQIIALIEKEPETKEENTPKDEPPKEIKFTQKQIINLIY